MSEQIIPMGRTVMDQDLFDKYEAEEGKKPVCGISGQDINVGDEVEMQEIQSETSKPYHRLVLVSVLPKEKSMEDILGDEDDAEAALSGGGGGEGEDNGRE